MVGTKLQRQLAPTHKSTAIAPNKTLYSNLGYGTALG